MSHHSHSHAGHATWATLHLCHLTLHLHHVLVHGFLDFGVLLSDKVHDRLLEIFIADAGLDEKRVFDLGLIYEHIDHHFLFVIATLSGLALQVSLLLHGVHGQLLGDLESSEGLRLLELRARLGRSQGFFTWQFTLLGGHDHLLVLRVLHHHLHSAGELLLARVRKNINGLLHDNLAHLVLSHELISDDVAVFVPIFVLIVLASLIDSCLSLF